MAANLTAIIVVALVCVSSTAHALGAGDGDRVAGLARARASVALIPITLTLAAEPQSVTTITQSASSTPPSSGVSVQRIIGFSSIGLGVVGFGFGVALGLVAGEQHAQLSGTTWNRLLCSSSSSGVCPRSQQEALSAIADLRTGSAILYVVGAVAAATGLVLVFTTPKRPTPGSASVAPFVDLGMVGMKGAF